MDLVRDLFALAVDQCRLCGGDAMFVKRGLIKGLEDRKESGREVECCLNLGIRDIWD